MGLTTPEGALISYIRYTGMCKQYKDDRDEDSLLDLYEVEIGVVLDASSLRRPFMRAYVLWNRACKGQTIHAGVSQAFSHARGHFTSLARFARWTKKKGRLLVNYEARRSLTKKPKDYKLFYQVER